MDTSQVNRMEFFFIKIIKMNSSPSITQLPTYKRLILLMLFLAGLWLLLLTTIGIIKASSSNKTIIIIASEVCIVIPSIVTLYKAMKVVPYVRAAKKLNEYYYEITPFEHVFAEVIIYLSDKIFRKASTK